jgi:hypothetical protein
MERRIFALIISQMFQQMSNKNFQNKRNCCFDGKTHKVVNKSNPPQTLATHPCSKYNRWAYGAK